ncbi:MAG: alpha-amylase family glycosyl hydrolase [Ferruginibacter sp.]
MKKRLLLLLAVFTTVQAFSQLLTWTPQFSNDNSNITIIVDATKGNQGLMGYNGAVYMHIGLITSASTVPGDWKYVPTAWGSTTAPQATSLGNNKWSFTINNPRAYFNAPAGVPAGEAIYKIAILFRDAGGSKVQKNADGSDMYVPLYPSGTNSIIFTTPALVPAYYVSNESATVAVGQSLSVTATASSSAGTLNLYFNGVKIAGPVTGAATISGTGQVTQTGTQRFIAELTLNNNTYRDTFQFYLPPANVTRSLPSGVREGINYYASCDSVTLVLFAPNKQNAVVLGDFEPDAWQPKGSNQMYKTPDGSYYWITLRNLTPGVEYTFQYLVDNSIYIADPYSEKILDPWNDRYIPTATYPNLKPYPENADVTPGTNKYMSILQTCQEAYPWKVTKFAKPDKRNLVIYELLIRDFGAAKNYQMLIDTIGYLKNLGINAIELMPVNEFSGNESWGYNPIFYLALDKAYGTKNKFKEFIDLCHQNGIAVILDVVYNQLDAGYAPQGLLYWDAANNRPAANNPWLNQSDPHPYGVFNDLNHTAVATQTLVRRALDYWVAEYKVDGYRFDLAKGFTQRNTINPKEGEPTVEDYDATRVANLNRYYDYITGRYPGTYVILEFLGQQRQEEQEYANRGYMLWSECFDQYRQAGMGYNSNSDLSKIMYNSSQTAFTTPAAVGYMESHDKDRMAYAALTYGNSNGSYNVKDTTTALSRMGALASVLLTAPGPKMIWQFGERGYDVTINYCNADSIAPGDGCRVNNKPPQWEKFADPRRKALYDVYSKLINLRLLSSDLYNSSTLSYNLYDNNGLVKQIQLSDNNPSGLKINVIANLDVVSQTRSVTFNTTGTWINYLGNGGGSGLNGATNTTFNLASASQNITLAPGEYHVYLYQPANTYVFNGNGNWSDASNWLYNKVPPSTLPTGGEIIISTKMGGKCMLDQQQTIAAGAKLTVAEGKQIQVPLNLTIQQ